MTICKRPTFDHEFYRALKVAKQTYFSDGSIIYCGPVGSRVTCNPPPTDTDDDRLFLVRNLAGFASEMICRGWKQAGSLCGNGNEVLSFRKGVLNVIATEDQQFYMRFLAASHVARELNLLEKEQRVLLFQAVLYGNQHGPNRGTI